MLRDVTLAPVFFSLFLFGFYTVADIREVTEEKESPISFPTRDMEGRAYKKKTGKNRVQKKFIISHQLYTLYKSFIIGLTTEKKVTHDFPAARYVGGKKGK